MHAERTYYPLQAVNIYDRVQNTDRHSFFKTKPERSFLHFKSTKKLCQSPQKFDITTKIRALITMLGFCTYQLP